MQNIPNLLAGYGLTKKEAGLYLASLALGEATMSALARWAKLKRTSAYLVFKSLEDRGLMGSFKMSTGLRFVATKPEILLAKGAPVGRPARGPSPPYESYPPAALCAEHYVLQWSGGVYDRTRRLAA